MNKLCKNISFLCVSAMILTMLSPAGVLANDDGMNMYQNSDFIEKEQPELNDETKELISRYQKEPTDENYLKLRNIVIENYNAVLDKKEAKLAELKEETAGKPGGDEKVAEMEEIVQDMYITYWDRINSNMLRFTDTRLLKWSTANASQYEYIPVMGAGESIYIKYTPVTNVEYAEFIKETKAALPENWTGGSYPDGEDSYPVNFVSYNDAKAYCEWLTKKDGVNTYRLPNESEWELAAGHMPKDADFNCGINNGRTPVEQYAGITRGAHGAIDFWGNVWEWTTTIRTDNDGTTMLGVKGGSWSSERTDCRTENRKESRDSSKAYEDVGFRVIQVLNGAEPEKNVELATLENPVVSAKSMSPYTITLSWQPVEGATEYQLFEYYKSTGLVKMLETVKDNTVTIDNLEPGSTHSYIVQPISYTSIADNVSAENSIEAVCMQTEDTAKPEVTTTPLVTSTSEAEVTETPDITTIPQVTSEPEETEKPSATVEPQVTEKPEVTVEPEVTVQPEETVKPEVTVAPETTPIPDSTITKEMLEENAITLNEKLRVSQEKNKIYISWGKLNKADGYKVYVQYCNKQFASPLKVINNKNVTSVAVTKVNGSKINLKKNYKVYVVAYKNIDNKKELFGKTITAHIVGRKNASQTNARAVKVEKKLYILKKNAQVKIKAKTILVDKNKQLLSDEHEKEFRYATGNTKVATISKDGQLKAVGNGKCFIYVYARNGYANKIKVVVKP